MSPSDTEPPVSDSGGSVRRSDSPVGRKDEALSLRDAPVRGKNAPVSHTDPPVLETGASVGHTDAPVREMDPSVHHTGAPVRGTDVAVRHTGTPVREMDPSVRHTGTPVRGTAAPVRRTDPPVHETDASVRHIDASVHGTDASVSVNDPSFANVTALHGVTPEALRAFLSRVETRTMLMSIVASKVPMADVENLVQDAIREALETSDRNLPDREEALRAWLATIARRVVADFFVKRARRAKYEGPMPDYAAADEGDDDESEHGKPPAPPEPSYDPRAAEDGDGEVHGWLVREWLEKQVGAHPRDRETLAIVLEHGAGKKTYEQIAEEHGLTPAALSSRIFEFKAKYTPRYRRWRNRALTLIFLGGAAIAAIVVALWIMWSRPAEIGPDRAPPRPSAVPVPSATASATPEPFEPALPTPPKRPPPPVDKPPNDKP
jgi:DNA-directed RNA polymerase specialized sigma24 family protein